MNERRSEEKVTRRGLMLVLSSPSGAGKTTLANKLLEHENELELSVSVTTRPPRPGEADGEDYIFVVAEKFAKMREDGAFLEWALVFDHFYGTPREPVELALASGRDVLFDIDWQGAAQLSKTARDDLVTVFILPPSGKALEQRLRTRAQDSDEVVRRRMAGASNEIQHWDEYDYVIVNKEIDDSFASLKSILVSERLRRERQIGLSAFVRDVQAELA